MTPIAWIVLIAILLIIEAMTVNLTTIWLAAGCAAAFAASLLGAEILPQWLIFFVVSLVLLIVTRPLAKKLLKQGNQTKTNVDALVGKRALVTKEINNRYGRGEAALEGKYWTAVSSDDSVIIGPGETVVVLEIRGVKLIVKKEQ